ncbi:MAG: hypothetical protein WC485_11345 [Opitutaceae bacterium]
MKLAIIICSGCATFSAITGVVLLSPGEAELRYAFAHEALERLAFKEGGSEELKRAVTEERIANKAFYFTRELARSAAWVSAALSAASLGLALFSKAKRPNQHLRATEQGKSGGEVEGNSER